MRSNGTVRRLAPFLITLGATSIAVLGVGAGQAWANVKGSYAVTSDLGGRTEQFDIVLSTMHSFTASGDVRPGAHGTYTYKHHVLTFTFTNNDFGTVYTGNGSPAAGFSGTAVVNNNARGCLPQGTSSPWSSGPIGSGSSSRIEGSKDAVGGSG